MAQCFGFLTGIVEGSESHGISRKTIQDVFRAVLQEFIPNIKLAGPRGEGPKCVRISSRYIPSTFFDSEQIIQLLRQFTSLDLGPQVHQLFDKLEKLMNDEEPAIAFKGFFLPFAKELSKTLADESTDGLGQEVQSRAQLFMENIVDLYARRCVGPKPTPPGDWRREKCGCGCTECLGLDAFLVDPTQKEIQISTESQDRVDHLKQQFPRIDQGEWKGDKPEHDTEVTRTNSGFKLSIRKTQLAWSTAARHWVEDRNAAEEEFGRVFDDENIKKSLETRLERLGHKMDSAA